MKVSLPPDLKRWIDQQVKTGGYATASEFLQDMIRRARRREQRRRTDSLLIEAVKSGAKTKMDDDDWEEIRRAARAIKRPA